MCISARRLHVSAFAAPLVPHAMRCSSYILVDMGFRHGIHLRREALIIQAMAVLSKIARSCHAIEQNLNRTVAATLRKGGGVYINIPIDMIHQTTFAKRWESDTPRVEDFCRNHGEFKDRLETELGANLTEYHADSLCCLIAVFAIHSGYLPLSTMGELNDATHRQWLAWLAIWCLYEDAGKERVRKLLNKYMHAELTSQNINALIHDVKNAMWENRLRPQTCANNGCAHLGKTYGCQQCRAVFYCSRKCQETDWLRHKSECTQHRDYAALKKGSTETTARRYGQRPRKDTLVEREIEPEPEITPETSTEPEPEIIPEAPIPCQSMTTRRVRRGRCSNDACNKKASKTCIGCETTLYCSKACQKADWPNHRKRCPADNPQKA